MSSIIDAKVGIRKNWVPRRPECQKVSLAGARRGKGEGKLLFWGRRFGRKDENQKGKRKGRKKEGKKDSKKGDVFYTLVLVGWQIYTLCIFIFWDLGVESFR